MTSQTFSGYWRQLKAGDKFWMIVFLWGISLWAWMPPLGYVLFFAGIHERALHQYSWPDALNIALPIGLSLAWFLPALRGEGGLRARIIRQYDNAWRNRKAA
ncbi:hypothetical protein [Candidatus Foliamicus sp.]